MGVGCVGIETLVFHLVNNVGPLGEELVFYTFEVVAYYHRFKLNPEFRCKLTAFGEELKAHVGHFAVLEFAIYD